MVKGISFRWKEETIELLNEGAEMTGVTKTKFASDAVELLHSIISLSTFQGVELEELKRQVILLLNGAEVSPQPPRKQSWNARPAGYILDLIYEFLKKRKGVLFSTTAIADELSIPRSTTRAYIRKLVSEYPLSFVLVEGRPNQIKFVDNNTL